MNFSALYKRSGVLVSILNNSDAKLIKALNDLPAKIEGKIVRTALRNGAKITLRRFKDTAHEVSGRMKRGAKIRAMKRKRGRIGVKIELRSADVSYGPFAELGHFQGPRDAAGRKFVPGLNTLKDAFRDTEDIVEGNIRKEIFDGIAAAATVK